MKYTRAVESSHTEPLFPKAIPVSLLSHAYNFLQLNPGRHPLHCNAASDPLVLGSQLKSQVCRSDHHFDAKRALPEDRLSVVPVAVLQLLVYSLGRNVQGAYPLHPLVRHTFRKQRRRIV